MSSNVQPASDADVDSDGISLGDEDSECSSDSSESSSMSDSDSFIDDEETLEMDIHDHHLLAGEADDVSTSEDEAPATGGLILLQNTITRYNNMLRPRVNTLPPRRSTRNARHTESN